MKNLKWEIQANVCPDASAPRHLVANSRVLTQSTRCKSFSQWADFLTSEDLISLSLYNSVTGMGVKEFGTKDGKLGFHSVREPEMER